MKKYIKKLIVLFAVVAIIVTVFCIKVNATTKGIVTGKYLTVGTNVKITPNIASINIYTTTEDTSIDILEQINEWSYISVSNLKGWVRNDNIEDNTNKEEAQTQETNSEEKTTVNIEKTSSDNKTAYVKYNNVNLRKEPSTNASVIEKLKMNTEVTIIEEVDSVWTKVKVGDNTGYISQDLLSSEKQKEENKEETSTTSRDGDTTKRENETTKKDTTTENKKETSSKNTNKEKSTTTNVKTETKTNTNTTSKTKGEEIVAYAMQFLGKPYVYGGSSPKGFDCSGFTSYVYKHFGYTLSRAASGQASEGTKVAKKDLQPGDLVIYKNQSLTRIGHVGIYIGNNKMIHASEPGVGVIITEIDAKSHNYPKRFVMGRRIIK